MTFAPGDVTINRMFTWGFSSVCPSGTLLEGEALGIQAGDCLLVLAVESSRYGDDSLVTVFHTRSKTTCLLWVHSLCQETLE